MATTGTSPNISPYYFRPRFSLRTLLLFVAIVAGILVVANRYLRPKIEHRIAVGRIFGSGGMVWFVDPSEEIGEQNPYTKPVQNLWRDVASIDVKNDAQAFLVSQELARLPEAGSVEFGPGVTDKGLSEFCDPKRRTPIESVSFYLSSVSSAGLSKLANLPKLRLIMFNTCPVNSTGIGQLKTLSHLQRLIFIEEPPGANFNRLNDPCFAEIEQLVNLQELVFGNVNVTDSAARKLRSLKQLKKLSFHNGYISDGAVSELRTALPETEILVY